MEKPQILSVNLAKNRGESVWDQFITWSLNAGRVVVILTEVIALAAFLYRFSLDRTLVDLHDRITQEQSVLTLLKGNEALYRNLQSRLKIANVSINQSGQTLKTFQNILSLIPTDLDVTVFTMTHNTFRLEGTSSSIASLRSFVDKLKSYPNVASVSLDQIQTNTATATVDVNISVTLND